MGYTKDLSGLKINRLTVISYSHQQNKRSYWKCLCECGNTLIIQGYYITTGHTKSCGCFQKESRFYMNKTHGQSCLKTPEYNAYNKMKARCYNKKTKDYINYGGRGITVCDEWLIGFEAFFEDMGIRPSQSHSLDRIDVNGNYCKENCRWALPIVQQNNRRNNVKFTIDGVEKNLSQWLKPYGIKNSRVHEKMKYGMTKQEAVEYVVKRQMQKQS